MDSPAHPTPTKRVFIVIGGVVLLIFVYLFYLNFHLYRFLFSEVHKDRQQSIVPFYIYDGDVVRNIREACKGVEQLRTNHGTGHEFLIALESHPWRVTRPEDALIFIVPAYTSPMFRDLCKGRRKALYQMLSEEIEQTWYYQRYQGMDHMILDTDFVGAVFLKRRDRELGKTLRNFIQGHYLEDKNKKKAYWRCSVPVPTIPSATHEALHRVRKDWFVHPTYEQWNARKFNLMFQGQTTLKKESHKNRRQAVSDLVGHFSPAVLVSNTDEQTYRACTPDNLEGCYETKSVGQYLDRLWDSKFGLHLGGDDPHSFRFYDILASGGIAIAAASEFRARALPSQCEIPWDEFVIFADGKNYTARPVETIKKAMASVDEAWITNAIQKQIYYQPYYLWELDAKKVSELALKNAVRKCFTDDMMKRVGLTREADFPCTYRNGMVAEHQTMECRKPCGQM